MSLIVKAYVYNVAAISDEVFRRRPHQLFGQQKPFVSLKQRLIVAAEKKALRENEKRKLLLQTSTELKRRMNGDTLNHLREKKNTLK